MEEHNFFPCTNHAEFEIVNGFFHGAVYACSDCLGEMMPEGANSVVAIDPDSPDAQKMCQHMLAKTYPFPLVAWEAAEGCALPVFSIREPGWNVVTLGMQAVLRRLREMAAEAAKAGVYLPPAEQFDIQVMHWDDFVYGTHDTAIFAVVDGRRQGLLIRTPMQYYENVQPTLLQSSSQ